MIFYEKRWNPIFKKIAMLQNLSIFSIFFLLVVDARAQKISFQTERHVISINSRDIDQPFHRSGGEIVTGTMPLEVPSLKRTPFLAVSMVFDGWEENKEVNLVFLKGNAITESIRIQLESDTEHTIGRFVSQLYFMKPEIEQFCLVVSGEKFFNEVEIHFYSPDNSPSTSHDKSVPVYEDETAVCPCPKPSIIQRSDWCPGGNCPPISNPSITPVTHLIIHHSAGSNTSGDWAAVVRSIWDFHVNVNLWSDIGYNWLIDPSGTIYDARGDNILGAHFCGKNSNTAGVCIMGTYTTTPPPPKAVSSVIELFAWKSCQVGVNPTGTSFHPSTGFNLYTISGHRDGCSTECPGALLYAALPSIRDSISNYIKNQCSPLTSVKNASRLDEVFLTPNPSRYNVLIEIRGELTGKLDLELFDQLGRRIQQLKIIQKSGSFVSENIDISNLPQGLYWLKVSHASGSIFKKLVVAN
jgi:hypothetical protein